MLAAAISGAGARSTFITGEDGALMILVEARFYPFLLMSVRGNSHSEAEYDAMFEKTEQVARRALRERTKHICISVSSGNMSAAERKFVARRVEAAPKELETVVLRSYVIAESATFRGVLTALRWLVPKLATIEAVATVDVAMTAASAVFKEHGIQVGSAEVLGARQWLEEQARLQRRTSTMSL